MNSKVKVKALQIYYDDEALLVLYRCYIMYDSYHKLDYSEKIPQLQSRGAKKRKSNGSFIAIKLS